DIGPVNETQGFTNVVIGDEHADSAGRQMLHKLLDVGHCDGVNTGEGFVQEHEVGLARKGAGDFEAATLTTGKRDGWRLSQVADVEFLKQRVEHLLALLAAL